MKKMIVCFLPFFIFGCATVMNKISMIKMTKDEQVIKENVDREVAGDENKKMEKIENEKKMEKEEEKTVKTEQTSNKYIVKKGDSLWKIAKEQIGTPVVWQQIAEQNNIKQPYVLQPGQEILLSDSYKITDKTKKIFEYRTVKNDSFGAGERLVFAVKYFGITAGHGILYVKDIVEINGRKSYYIEATAKTSSFFEKFYRVHDIISSYMDVRGLFSWKYSKNLQEGSYRNNSYMEFYHEQGYAMKKEGDRCQIPAFVQDVLSELYYYRAIFTGQEKEIYIDVASDECKVYQILVEKIREEKVKVDAGEFDCYVVRPHLKYEGIFRQMGDLDIWFTKDKYKIPVLVKSKIVIGTIDAVLQEATIVESQ
jgi:LysM repeat protein